MKGNYDQAIADYNQAIQLNPNQADYYYSRALSYRAQGQKTQAKVDEARARDLSRKGKQ